MKLKKVASLCTESKIFRMYDRTDADGVVEQWLGDASTAYPMRGLPYLDEENLYRIFDVPEKTREKMFFNHGPMPEGINVDDFANGERLAEDSGMTISFGGTVLLPLRYSGGILYIQTKYLAPLDDQLNYLQLYVRRTESGGRYIAAKAGMLLVAVIFPYDAIREGFVDRLDEIAGLTRRELEKRRNGAVGPQAVDETQQRLFEEKTEGGDCEP